MASLWAPVVSVYFTDRKLPVASKSRVMHSAEDTFEQLLERTLEEANAKHPGISCSDMLRLGKTEHLQVGYFNKKDAEDPDEWISVPLSLQTGMAQSDDCDRIRFDLTPQAVTKETGVSVSRQCHNVLP